MGADREKGHTDFRTLIIANEIFFPLNFDTLFAIRSLTPVFCVIFHADVIQHPLKVPLKVGGGGAKAPCLYDENAKNQCVFL